MIKIIKNICLVSLLAILVACSNNSKFPSYGEAKNMKTKNMVQIPELVMEDILGANVLSQPIHIQGTINEIITEKHGYAYPAMYDWNKDGLQDLLIGEFETGESGSFLQIHLNTGTNEHPVFTGQFEYATDVNGNTITAYYWCCIGLHPRFVDLTGDGIDDMITGSYNPGIVTMWEGSDKGFRPATIVEQEGDTKNYVMGLPFTDNRSLNYWNYSSIDLADFNGDGLYDLFVAGSGGMRVALNIGTKTKPKFGYRELLLDVDGKALIYMDQQIIDEHNKDYVSPISGDMKSYVNAYDWDGDGVLDLLANSSYSYEGQKPIDFFRGVKTPKGIRFEKSRALFNRKDGGNRPFPGSATQIKVCDYNNDGLDDLLIGMSILTVQGYTMVDSLAWMTLEELNLPRVGKDLGAGYADPKRHKENMEMYQQIKKTEPKIEIPWYLERELDDQIRDIYSTRHRGYVYVMYGQEPKSEAKVKVYENAGDFELPAIFKIKTKEVSTMSQGPVSVTIESSENADGFDIPLMAKITFKMKPGWYLYADTPYNRKKGYIPTSIEFTAPAGIEVLKEDLRIPPVNNPEGIARYSGNELVFEQVFRSAGRSFYKLKERFVDVKITYQTCDKDLCLPPVTITERITFPAPSY